MRIAQLDIAGAFALTPQQHADSRGVFLEWYRHEAVADAVGHPLYLAQANCSVSARGVLRGIHYADVPPGQAKYVTCASGAVIDVIVDLRDGSPTFGQWDSVRLDDQSRTAVYIAEGLGHAFVALSDPAVVMYLCSTVYTPSGEHTVDLFDPDLAIDWTAMLDGAAPLVSDRDREAPSLASARSDGLLPRYAECLAYYDDLRQDDQRQQTPAR